TNMADYGESLESWLNKATNPSNRQEDWEYIMMFCDQINKELEGPQISVRLLAYKIQSPQEWEAMQALTVLEACMKNCGRRFHNEVGKFKFLNELIKVVSPKYLGDKVSEQVKKKVIEMLYSWTVSLPDETKIAEAYQMLKLQGIVLADPEIPLDATLIPSPSPRPKNPVFEDEKKSKRLSELLKSKKPEDLQEANRLIKNMVKEVCQCQMKSTKQKSTLEAVNNSVKLLNEMLAHFNPEDSTDADRELIRELYGDCDKLRQTVVQLATETEDNDSSLGDILQANDDLSQVINLYKKIVEGQTMNGETGGRTGSTNQSEILIDLVGLDIQSSSSVNVPSTALSLLDEELLSLGNIHNLSLFFFFALPTLLGKVCPVTAYDKNGVRVLLHFATDFPPGRPDVLVMVASMLNTATQPVKNIVLQAAVPRTMKVKLQPPSGTELASFNPILPPAAITQIMLLANPLKEKVRMRYKLGFTLGDQPFTEVGEVNDFPPVDKWGAL
uniref:Golgi associated, gamma adaptin ear containing, ARF binding protein 3a n=1 Tax=Astatotilapia calliptera TaxID=8154 RepID=A0AAX7W3M5_ASTCA